MLHWTEADGGRRGCFGISLIWIGFVLMRPITGQGTTTAGHGTTTSGGGKLIASSSPIKIAVVEEEPFFVRQSGPVDTFTGYLVDLVREMSQTTAFDFEWLVIGDSRGAQNASAAQRKAANWTEIAARLANGSADVAVLPLNSVTVNQSRRLSHTRPFLKSTLSLLTKALLSPAVQSSISFENLLNEIGRDRIGVTSDAVAQLLRTSNWPLYRGIWNDTSPSEVPLSLDEGLRKIRERGFILIMESTEAGLLASTEPCDLVALDQPGHETNYVLAARQNSALVPQLDNILGALEASDFFGALFRKWWATDDCVFRREDAKSKEHEDYDSDMERIFFTSPIKNYRTRVTAPSPLGEPLDETAVPYPSHGHTHQIQDTGHNSVSQASFDALHRKHTHWPTSPTTTVEDRKSHHRSRKRQRMSTESSTASSTSKPGRPRDRSKTPETNDMFHHRSTSRLRPTEPGTTLNSLPPWTRQNGKRPAASSDQNTRTLDSSTHPDLEDQAHLEKPHRFPTVSHEFERQHVAKYTRNFGKELDWFFVTHLPRDSAEDEFYDDFVGSPIDEKLTEQEAAVNALNVNTKTRQDDDNHRQTQMADASSSVQISFRPYITVPILTSLISVTFL